MANSSKSNHGGNRKGAGNKPKPSQERKIQTNLCVQMWVWDIFVRLILKSRDRSILVEKWIRAYAISKDSDLLLSQAPLAIKLLNHLEATKAPEELIEELKSLLVARASDEVRMESGAGATRDRANSNRQHRDRARRFNDRD